MHKHIKLNITKAITEQVIDGVGGHDLYIIFNSGSYK